VDGLSVDGFYSVDKSFNFSKSFSTPYTLYTYNKNNGAYTGVVTGGSAGAASIDQSQLNITNITQNLRLSYLKTIGKHNINAFVAYEQNKRNEAKFGATRINFPDCIHP
jgi:UDP-N-acetylglucosamine:LPS N-acetylglucosamine transferase